MISINTNLGSLIVQNNLKTATKGLNQAIERMTTGFKINGAKDNAANFAISTQLDTKISAYNIAEENVSMGLDLVTTASDSLSQIEDKLARLRALQEQASNGTYGEDPLKAINSEVSAIVDEIERIYSTTEYNGIKLFSSETSDTITGNGMPTVNEDGFIQTITRQETDSLTKLSSVSESTTISSGKYSISTAEELAQLATMTNSGKIAAGAEFVLANDIDLSTYLSGEGWVPIGKEGASFKAKFDGNGYTISNLYINRAENMYQGLFGHANGCTIKNLGIENVKIQARNFVAALVGYAINSNITNCFVKNASIEGNAYVAGLAGQLRGGEVNESSAVADVTGGSSAGGLISNTAAVLSITNCFSSGTVNSSGDAGGIIGWNESQEVRITNSYTTSRIKSPHFTVGAFIGGYLNSYTTTIIENCYYNSAINPLLRPIGISDRTLEVENQASLKDFAKNVDLNLQVGINGDSSSVISLQTSLNLSNFNLRTVGRTHEKFDRLQVIDELLMNVSAKLTEYGAAQNRLESALEQIGVCFENLVSTRSTIKDADVAKESSEYIRNQILQQASATLLATANQTPSIALQLL